MGEAQRRLRFDVYLAECGVLALCTLGHILGVIDSLFLSAAWSTGFRSPVDKYEFALKRLWTLTYMYERMDFSIWGTVLGVAFITARSSALAFFCNITLFGLVLSFRLYSILKGLMSHLWGQQFRAGVQTLQA